MDMEKIPTGPQLTNTSLLQVLVRSKVVVPKVLLNTQADHFTLNYKKVANLTCLLFNY